MTECELKLKLESEKTYNTIENIVKSTKNLALKEDRELTIEEEVVNIMLSMVVKQGRKRLDKCINQIPYNSFFYLEEETYRERNLND